MFARSWKNLRRVRCGWEGARREPSFLLLLRSLVFYLAENSAEWAFVGAMESFLSFAIGTKEHSTRLAMLPISSAGMTLWTGGHFYSPFTALAVYVFVNRLC